MFTRFHQIRKCPQVIYPGHSELSPPNLVVVNSEPDHCNGPEHHQIPYVEGIVCITDTQQRLLLVDPPRGLLDLGRQQAAFQYLEPLLQVYLSQMGVQSLRSSVTFAMMLNALSSLHALLAILCNL